MYSSEELFSLWIILLCAYQKSFISEFCQDSLFPVPFNISSRLVFAKNAIMVHNYVIQIGIDSDIIIFHEPS